MIEHICIYIFVCLDILFMVKMIYDYKNYKYIKCFMIVDIVIYIILKIINMVFYIDFMFVKTILFLDYIFGIIYIVLKKNICIQRKICIKNLNFLNFMQFALVAVKCFFEVLSLYILWDTCINNFIFEVNDVLFIVINMLILQAIVIYYNIKNIGIERLYERVSLQNKVQKIYYEALLKKEEETKHFRHDINNHLIYIKELAEENNNRDIVNYIDNIVIDIKKIENIGYFTGNKVVDIAMNYYFCELNKNIKVNITGYMEDEIGVNKVDLNIIFGNIFKNIAEELKECKKGYINIYINRGNKYMRVIIENSLNKEKEDILKKENNFNYGYGLNNMTKAIERNDGAIEYEKTEEKYIVKITFKQLI